MLKYTFHRILTTLPIVFGVITLTFLLIHFVPGDPVDIMLGDQATAFDRAALNKELGLDRPLPQQYASYLIGLTQLDLGRSLQSKRPVWDEIIERMPATVELTFFAILVSVLIGIPLGVLAAIYHNSWFDHSILFGGLVGLSMPSFWLGPMLILLFSIELDWLPVSERGGIEHLILPSLSLASGLAAILMRMTRASMLEVINEDYMTVARAKGVHPAKIYFKHALSNALMPIITILGLQFGALLTGTIIIETIFDWPGIGTLLYSSIQQRNYPLVQGCVLIIALIYVTVNFLTDLAYAAANPKVRIS